MSSCTYHATKLRYRVNTFEFKTKYFNNYPKRYICKDPCKKSGGNLSAVLTKVNKVLLEDRPKPIPTDNQVLLQMEVVGICGMDVTLWQKGRSGPFELKKPMVLGHEGSGTVLKCGRNVKNMTPGDQVAIEPGIPCRMCDFCKTGRYNLCPDMRFCASPPVNGNLCRYFCIDADFCYNLPCEMDLEEGALCEPLACGVHANKLAKVRLGSVCVVQGAGPIGLSTAAVAKVKGASKVLITDVVDSKLKLAKKISAADYTLNVNNMEEMEVAFKILETLEEEPHATFECAGTLTAARMGLHITRAGGRVVLLGIGAEEMSLPFEASLIKEITIIGSYRYVNDYTDTVELFRSKKVNLKPIITHHFKLEDTVKALETLRDKKDNPIKICIHCNSAWKPKTC